MLHCVGPWRRRIPEKAEGEGEEGEEEGEDEEVPFALSPPLAAKRDESKVATKFPSL